MGTDQGQPDRVARFQEAVGYFDGNPEPGDIPLLREFDVTLVTMVEHSAVIVARNSVDAQTILARRVAAGELEEVHVEELGVVESVATYNPDESLRTVETLTRGSVVEGRHGTYEVAEEPTLLDGRVHVVFVGDSGRASYPLGTKLRISGPWRGDPPEAD